jgi:hypothetical protein
MGCSSTKINSDSNSNNNYNRPCCCPSCGEPAGQNFKGSGNKQITFNCLKCGKKKEKENYFECNQCNCIFCNKCPQIKYDSTAACPSCGELAGENFQGVGNSKLTFNCLKCGKKKEKENYYECNKCNSIFCIQCPYLKNGIIAESHSYEGSYGGNVAGGLLGA